VREVYDDAPREIDQAFDAAIDMGFEYPDIDYYTLGELANRMEDELAGARRYAAQRKTAAGKPFLAPQGLNAKTVRDNKGFMVYSIVPPGDPRAKGPKGHSKFYEVLITEEPGSWNLTRAWGSIGDRSPRVVVEEHSSLAAAQRSMQKHYKKRMAPGKGYVSAFGPDHTFIDPQTGRKRKAPQGEYPLTFRTETPGFGHGFQEETACIPALRVLVDQIDVARDTLSSMGPEDIYLPDELVEQLGDALDIVTDVTSADSTMGGKLKKLIGAAQRRAIGGPRFQLDPGGTKLKKALYTIRNYIVRSSGYCA